MGDVTETQNLSSVEPVNPPVVTDVVMDGMAAFPSTGLDFPNAVSPGDSPHTPEGRHLHTRVMEYGDPYYEKGVKMTRAMCSCGEILPGRRAKG